MSHGQCQCQCIGTGRCMQTVHPRCRRSASTGKNEWFSNLYRGTYVRIISISHHTTPYPICTLTRSALVANHGYPRTSASGRGGALSSSYIMLRSSSSCIEDGTGPCPSCVLCTYCEVPTVSTHRKPCRSPWPGHAACRPKDGAGRGPGRSCFSSLVALLAYLRRQVATVTNKPAIVLTAQWEVCHGRTTEGCSAYGIMQMREQ